jgi:proteasome alpha subunit
MPMPYYVSPEQMMQDKAEYAKLGIAKGSSIISI